METNDPLEASISRIRVDHAQGRLNDEKAIWLMQHAISSVAKEFHEQAMASDRSRTKRGGHLRRF